MLPKPRTVSEGMQLSFDTFSDMDSETLRTIAFNVHELAREPGISAELRLNRLQGAFAALYVLLDREGLLP